MDRSCGSGLSSRRRSCGRWFRVTIYAVFLLAGQCTATLLGRLYFDGGGDSMWVATLVQSAGFPLLFPFFWFFSSTKIALRRTPPPPSLPALLGVYLALGLLLAGDNLLYSYGLLFLPLSTYSLLCATQLVFTVLFSFLLNSQRLTPFVLNSVVLLTVSASLLGLHAGGEVPPGGGKYAAGFLCTVGASAAYALYLALVQLSFDKLIKAPTGVLEMQVWPSFVASCACVVGVFGSGEWKGVGREMRGYRAGEVSYVMTLVWTAASWQVSSVGLLGLIQEVSSLFSNVVGTVGLPLVPALAALFFHDRMDGVKGVAMALAVWGFLSYIYQTYLDGDDDGKTMPANEDGVETSGEAMTESC